MARARRCATASASSPAWPWSARRRSHSVKGGAIPGETTLERRPFLTGQDPSPCDLPALIPSSQAPQSGPAYYDLSMLKAPVWGAEVALYFFLGGLSAGAYPLARSAERFGGERHRRLTQAGTVVAVLAVPSLSSAPLLIADLGDPKRFLKMLRVFKPRSPMNLGVWTLTAYTGAGDDGRVPRNGWRGGPHAGRTVGGREYTRRRAGHGHGRCRGAAGAAAAGRLHRRAPRARHPLRYGRRIRGSGRCSPPARSTRGRRP